MLTYESLISLLFRWIDFFIIVAGASYIFWRWGRPFLSKVQEDQQSAWHEIEHTIAQSVARAQLLEQRLQQDRLLINELEQKVNLWKAVVQKRETAARQQAKLISDRIIQESTYKEQRIKEIRLHTLAATKAFNDAERVLQETFSHKAKSESFVKAVIQRLQES